MAQKPSPTAKPSAAKSAPAAKKPAGRARKVLLWGGVAVLAVLAGLAVAWYFLVRPGGFTEGGLLRVTKDFLPGKSESKPGTAAPGAGPQAERTHTVKPGENLWAIAKKGDLVATPWEWRTILVQNKDKISYAFISEEDGAWKVMVEEGKELKVRPPNSTAQGAAEKQYAVQVLTVPENRLPYATGVVKTLLADGQYAYLYRRDFGGKSWYRIRAGFFPSQEQARQAGEAILAKYADKKLFKEYWVMLPSHRELRGELIDFGAQQVKPWVAQLPDRGTHEKSLEDLRALSPETEFVYISQRKDKDSGKFIYRTRVGFFTDEQKAQAFIAQKSGTVPVLADAKAVKVENFEEALPGQNLKLGKPEPGAAPAAAPDAKSAAMPAPAGAAKAGGAKQ